MTRVSHQPGTLCVYPQDCGPLVGVAFNSSSPELFNTLIDFDPGPRSFGFGKAWSTEKAVSPEERPVFLSPEEWL